MNKENKKALAKALAATGKWYYYADGLRFVGFAFLTDDYSEITYFYGGFKTFKECKQDAIDRYTHDVMEAKQSLINIRKARKSDYENKRRKK